MKLPKDVEDKLRKYAKKSETDPESILKEYIKEFADPWIQGDGWLDDADRHNFLCTEFKKNYVLRAKASEYAVMPFGMTSIKRHRTTKEPSCNLYVLAKGEDDEKFIKRRIMVKGASIVKKLNHITWLCKYQGVKFGNFKDKEGNITDLIADDRTKFGEPEKTKMTYVKLIDSLGAKRTNINDALKNLTDVDKKGYPISTDFRVIRGMVKGAPVKNIEDPLNEICNYKIVDLSCGSEPIVTEEGKEVYPGITGWISSKMMKHDTDAMIDMIGITKEKKIKDPDDPEKYVGTGIVSMDVAFTVGIHERPREE